MKVRLLFDTQGWDLYSGTTISSVVFTHCENIVGVKEQYANFVTLTIDSISSTDFEITIYIVGTGSVSFTRATMGDFLDAYDFGMDAEITGTNIAKVFTMAQNDLVSYNRDGHTTIAVYKQNSANDVMNKSLTPVSMFDGIFNHSIAIKNINIDIKGYNILNAYNYVYIPSLKRYYYVDSVEIISADYVRLHLHEDVLMTWQELIKIQSAFVTRSENTYDDSIVDDRLPLQSVKTIEYISITPTGVSESAVNITLSGNFSSEYNILVTTYNDVLYTKTNVTAPDSNLPTLSPNQSNTQTTYFLTLSLYDSFTKALMNEDTMIASLGSILFLPFNPQTAFNTGTSAQTLMIGLPSAKALCSDDKFHYLYDIPSGVTTRQVRRTTYGTSPYLVLADFTFPNVSDYWYNREPYTYYEIYVAFVGWVKVDISQVNNKRLLIYYTLDLQTGNATAFIYNKTDSKVIYSCGCQLGVKLDVISSNYLELSREKQANQLNTLIGLLASAVSIGAGVVTENPVAIAGGVLSAGKTIASAVNKERMMFERAQVTFGSGDAGLHANFGTMLRKTTNAQILSGYPFNEYAHMQGLPLNQYVLSLNMTGYVEIGEIHFNPYNYNIYQDEIEEIVSLLKGGVVF